MPRTIICDEYVVLAAVAGDLEPALALAERRTTPSAYMRLLRPLHRFVLGNRDPGRYTDILGALSAETLDLLEGIPRDLVVLEDERMLLRQVARQSTQYAIPPVTMHLVALASHYQVPLCLGGGTPRGWDTGSIESTFDVPAVHFIEFFNPEQRRALGADPPGPQPMGL